MGLKNSRPLPLAAAELEMAPFFKRRFRTWHLDHVSLVVERYRALTSRHCIDSIQLSAILGIRDQSFIQELMRLFMPKTPTRVHHMIDAMEVVISLILVCQAPSMLRRYEAIFDVIDLKDRGVITPADVVVLFGAVGRAIMKIFRYTVEPNHHAAMAYVHSIVSSSGVADGGAIEKHTLCKHMLSDHHAVHYMKQCTGDDKPKLYVMLEKEAEFLGAIEFHTLEQMQSASLKTIRELAQTQLYKLPADFAFLCQGREVQRVWEADRRGWSIVPFALRGSPGLRTNAMAHNRHAERPLRANVFEFKYMGNALARYKKSVREIRPVYRHRGFKLAADGKPLAAYTTWRVAENWSGEWVYEQRKLAATSKCQLQKRLRNAPTASTQRVAVKNHQGGLISPLLDGEGDAELVPVAVEVPGHQHKLYANSPAAIAKKQQDRRARERTIKWRARMVAMQATQQLDGESPVDKENEPRRANRTASSVVDGSGREGKKLPGSATVLVRIQDAVQSQTSRLLASKCQAVSASNKLQVQVVPQKLELQPPSSLSSGQIQLGPFLTASNVALAEHEVEVFPVIVIRPIGVPVLVPQLPAEEDEEQEEQRGTSQYAAHPAYLSTFEFAISASESNYEPLYHHIHNSASVDDLLALNRRDVLGRTMLHDAAEHGHCQLLALLLSVRVLRDVGDCQGDTPLHHAARRGHLKEVSALLRAGIAPWQLNCHGKSALCCALEAAGKQMKQSAVSHKRPPLMAVPPPSANAVEQTSLLTATVYTKLRQVIDLLWDTYPVPALALPDHCQRTSCLALERQVFGDLFHACRTGNLARVQRLMDLDKRPVAQYINEQLEILGRTALHEAVEQGHSAIVDLLLKVGADVYVPDQRGQLALHLAAERGHARIVQCLAAKCPGTLHCQDASGRTALHLAAERNHSDVGVCLVAAIQQRPRHCQILDAQDLHGYTALHYACAYGDLALCQAIVHAGGSAGISRFETAVAPGPARWLGVHWKCQRTVAFDLDSPAELLLRGCRQRPQGYQDRIAILRLLLPRHAATARSLVKALPPPLFHLAVDLAETNAGIAIDVCKALHDLHFEINLVHPTTRESALLKECQRVCQRLPECQDLALVRTLVQLGASVDLPRDGTGETPLACAAWHGHAALLSFLLEAGAQCHAVPKASFSPLHFAALGDRLACARLLLAAAADANCQPWQLEAPLFFAIRANSLAMVELLLAKGADPCAVCHLQHGVATSFGIFLAVDAPKKKKKKSAMASAMARLPTFGPGQELLDDGVVTIASPLTLALLMARRGFAFSSQAEAVGAMARARRRHEWESLGRIALLLAQRAIAAAGSSLVTRNDVYLACHAGYWDVARLLLAQQVRMPNASTAARPNALHLAAAAGRTDVAVALVAAGMNVNCRVVVPGHTATKDLGSFTPGTLAVERTVSVVRHKGPLFFALIHGHVATAAKLLVLGARPLDSLPHTATTLAARDPQCQPPVATRVYIRLDVHESTTKQAKDQYFDRAMAREIEAPLCQEHYHHSRVLANFVSHVEASVNSGVPLLHYAAGMGYASVARLLIDAGMSFLTPEPLAQSAMALSGTCRREWRAETAIHVAILCGHLAVVELLAASAQHNFPRFFQRHGSRQQESLLVTASRTQRLDLLQCLLSAGGYSGADTPADVHAALVQCVRGHFVAGVALLLQREQAVPDLDTLAVAMDQLTWHALPAATAVVRQLVPFATSHYDHFFRVLSFDALLKILVLCARHELWFVLDTVLVANARHLLAPLAPWQPLLVRAASCCMVLHRAAAANETQTVAFFLRLGVPAELQLPELPGVRCPIYYAATRGALDTFLLLALHSPSGVREAVDGTRLAPPRPHYRSIHSSTSWFSSSSACKWQNTSAMSCHQVPAASRSVVLIAKFISLWLHDAKVPGANNSLLHLAAARADPLAVEALLLAGADVLAENAAHDTPLAMAATRKDGFGVAIVRLLLRAMAARQTEKNEEDGTASRCLSQALVTCFAQPAPCNLKTAKLLLAAGADVNCHGSSAMAHALRSVQFGAVKLLLDHGAVLSAPLVELLLAQFAGVPSVRHWRTYSSFLKYQGQRLLEAESLLALLLEKKWTALLNEDLAVEMLTATAAIAATTARRAGLDKRFWVLCARLIECHGTAIATRRGGVWGQKTALHYAVESLETAIVCQLVQQCGCQPHAEDEARHTPLHLVAANGDAAICQLLLAGTATVDVVDARGRTPLHVAVIHGHGTVVALLLAAGASLAKTCNHRGFNALLYAASLDCVAILMALYERDSARALLYAASGEFAAMVAAQNASFRAVRWLETVFSSASPAAFWQLKCQQCRRSLLHYAARFGDLELAAHILRQCAGTADVVNARDAGGYTPLLLAVAFGQLPVVELLLCHGADASASVDHSSEPGTHPYASRFGLATLAGLVALPGWFAYVSTQCAPLAKRSLALDSEPWQCQFASGFHRRRVKRPPVVVLGRPRHQLPATRAVVVRTGLRSWQFPRHSLLELACEVGDLNMVLLLCRLALPGLLGTSAGTNYAMAKRAFMEAVKWNRLEIVSHLLGTQAGSAMAATASSVKMSEFIEPAMELAVGRGLEEMALLLLEFYGGGGGENNSGGENSSAAFAFQFASVFQVACIRNMARLVERMVGRGGEQLVHFHWHDGPALLYAMAFGHTKLVEMLAEETGGGGGEMVTYVAPSFRKWIEFGCPAEVQVQWYEAVAGRSGGENILPLFEGPLETYPPPSERLDSEMMAALFLPPTEENEKEKENAVTEVDAIQLTLE